MRFGRADVGGEVRERSTSHLRQGSVSRSSRSVEEARDVELCGEPGGGVISERLSDQQRGRAKRDEGQHIDGAESGVNSLVVSDHDVLDRPSAQFVGRGDDVVSTAKQREHAAVVIRVSMEVN